MTQKNLGLVLRLAKTLDARRLLAVVFTLLLLEQGHHLIDCRDDLREIDTIAAECQRDQLQIGRGSAVRPGRPTKFTHRSSAHRSGCFDGPVPRGVLQGCLEELERVVMVQQLDGWPGVPRPYSSGVLPSETTGCPNSPRALSPTSRPLPTTFSHP